MNVTLQSQKSCMSPQLSYKRSKSKLNLGLKNFSESCQTKKFTRKYSKTSISYGTNFPRRKFVKYFILFMRLNYKHLPRCLNRQSRLRANWNSYLTLSNRSHFGLLITIAYDLGPKSQGHLGWFQIERIMFHWRELYIDRNQSGFYPFCL